MTAYAGFYFRQLLRIESGSEKLDDFVLGQTLQEDCLCVLCAGEVCL